MTGRHDERGTVALWVLGLCVAVLFVGGLGLDLWRAITVRRELVVLADTAATAGANGLDVASLRDGFVRLDPGRATVIARETLARHDRFARVRDAWVAVVSERVVVTLEDEVDFSLLRLFLGGEPFTVRVRAEAAPDPRE
jgi:hypothetical protein